MKLVHIPARHVDYAWRDGAHVLAQACADDCTVDQLKYAIALGERTLVRMEDDEKTVGWSVYRVEQYPNSRVLFVTNTVAPGSGIERFLEELKKLAESLGCSRVRCAAKRSQARLYQMKMRMKPVYQIMEMEV